MDSELKSYLENISRQLGDLKTDVARLDVANSELRDAVSDMRTELMAHTEAVETRLLTEFWKWAKTADARYRQSHSVAGALDDRMQAIEDRVSDLERRRAN